MTEDEDATTFVEMTAEIVSAYVEYNSVPPGDLPGLIGAVHAALDALAKPAAAAPAPEPLQPKVSIRKSISNDYVVCLEDGKRFKSLKRHLHAEHGLSPAEYRAKWGLGQDYPMVAPSYANARSALAKTIGLGRKAAGSEVDPDAAAVADDGEAAPATKPRGRPAKA